MNDFYRIGVYTFKMVRQKFKHTHLKLKAQYYRFSNSMNILEDKVNKLEARTIKNI